MDDLEKFIDFLYEGLEGIVGTGTLYENKMHETFFEWPAQKEAIAPFLRNEASKGSVYIHPVLLKGRARNKLNFKVSQVIWADFDGTNPVFPGDFPDAHMVVQSSSNDKVHMYWRIPPSTDLQAIENLNKRIAYGCNADINCWDATHLLRPPETINHKYSNRPTTKLSFFNDSRLADLDLPLPALPDIKSSVDLGSIPDAHILVSGLGPKLKEFMNSPVNRDRSSFLMSFGFHLAEEGYNVEQIVALVQYLDMSVGKFATRHDKLQRYIELACVAVAKTEPVQKYTPKKLWDILNSTEEIDWLLKGWIHRNGLMLLSGSPGVGKTQLASQLSYCLSTGTNFLHREVTRPVNTMILSLEMRAQEFKYIFSHQTEGLTEFQTNQWHDKMDFFDPVQENLEVYGQLIELYNPDVVIIDSVSELASEDLKETEARKITRWWDKVRYDTDTAIVVVHHDRKATSDNKAPKTLADIYGSFFFTKTPETVVTLWETKQAEQLELIALKARMDKKDTVKVKRNQHLFFELTEPQQEGDEFTNAGGQFAGIKPDGSINLDFGGLGS